MLLEYLGCLDCERLIEHHVSHGRGDGEGVAALRASSQASGASAALWGAQAQASQQAPQRINSSSAPPEKLALRPKQLRETIPVAAHPC
jgi:hypothetical protein